MLDKTITFSKIEQEKEDNIHYVLSVVYDTMKEKGYNPINQIVGYILSEDPTYISTQNNARKLISRLDRDELLRVLLRSYLENQK